MNQTGLLDILEHLTSTRRKGKERKIEMQQRATGGKSRAIAEDSASVHGFHTLHKWCPVSTSNIDP